MLPFLRDARVDIDDVILVDGPQAVQPLLKQAGLGAVFTAQAFDAQADLADCQRAGPVDGPGRPADLARSRVTKAGA